MNKKTYRTFKLEESVPKRARGIMSQIRWQGTESLPPELSPFFDSGVTLSAVLNAGLAALEKAWQEAKERRGNST